MRAPIFDEIEARKKVAVLLRDCLTPYGMQDEADDTELQIGNVIVENTGNAKRISRAVLDTMFPMQHTPCELDHYTSTASLQGIAASRELRLYAVRKRIG